MNVDWSQYARPELGLKDVQDLSRKTAKHWGFVPVGNVGHEKTSMMFEGGNDDFIVLRFLNKKWYESVTRELWRRICTDAPLVVDVGTHSGIFTMDAFRAGAKRVVSCEPHPINYARLVLNLRANGYPTEGLFYGAVGDENKVSALLVKNGLTHCHAAGRMDMHNPNGMEIPTRVARLDALIPQEMWPELRAVKIDAENWTPHVIRGMGKILEHHPDLIIECTEPGMGEMLKPYGYRFWRIWETGKIEETDDLLPHNPNKNYNGTDEDCRNRLASVRGLPNG